MRCARSGIVAGMVAVCAASAGAGECDTLFNALAVTNTVETGASEIEVGDLNGDGVPDLLVSLTSGGVLSAVLNFGGPNQLVESAFFGDLQQPTGSVIADLSGDGDPDIAVCQSGVDSIVVLISEAGGDLLFDDPLAVATATQPFSIDAGDLDADGDIDLVVAARGGVSPVDSSVQLFENLGGASFALADSLPLPGEAEQVLVTDLDGDGVVDIAAVSRGADDQTGLTLFFNDGLLTSGPGETAEFMGMEQMASIAAGDIDGDGDLDLAVNAGSTQGNGLFVIRQISQRAYTPPVPIDGAVFDGVEMGDIDSDGDLDLACGGSTSSITVFRNQGDGTFLAQDQVFGIGVARVEAMVDLDGDGDLELGFSTGSASVGFFVSQCGPADGPVEPVPGDVNGDGMVDSVDLNLVLANFGTGE